jgi:hypothetical protein
MARWMVASIESVEGAANDAVAQRQTVMQTQTIEAKHR